ncbi:MAG: hypothetical protein QM582_14415 [Micropruina sp.]|uniref:hypothetical protein n=1 Tax=Micropruina sp. TaxID=2737536 RepID=UPI0039E26E4E
MTADVAHRPVLRQRGIGPGWRGSMNRLVAGTLMVAVTSGCSFGVGQVSVSSDGFDPAGPTSAYSGTVEARDNGCVFLSVNGTPIWMVWPPGAAYESTGESQSNIRLADGTRIFHGDRIDVMGELITRSRLPQGDNIDSQWGSRPCSASATSNTTEKSCVRSLSLAPEHLRLGNTPIAHQPRNL